MTIPTDPVKAARGLVRHVRNSHAIGKAVFDTALRGVTGKLRDESSGAPRGPASTSPATSGPPAEEDPYAGLPLPVARWALLTSGEVVDMIEDCDDTAVRAIGAFEETHRRRRLVIQAVKNRLAW
jgi:hypothetical protein